MKDREQKIDAFLAELAELTKKHGINVYSCGCCPPLFIGEEEISDREELSYDEEKGVYKLGY